MMKRLTMIVAAGLALVCATGCDPGPVMNGINSLPTAPVEVANRTQLDEQVGITLTTAYTATARAAALAIESGLVKDRAQIACIGTLDHRAYNAVMAVRGAYLAANADSYVAGLRQANTAIRDLLAAAKGGAACH